MMNGKSLKALNKEILKRLEKGLVSSKFDPSNSVVIDRNAGGLTQYIVLDGVAIYAVDTTEFLFDTEKIEKMDVLRAVPDIADEIEPVPMPAAVAKVIDGGCTFVDVEGNYYNDKYFKIFKNVGYYALEPYVTTRDAEKLNNILLYDSFGSFSGMILPVRKPQATNER